MKYSDYKAQIEQDAEYQAIKDELKPLFDLADQVLEFRLDRGWSQSELARRAGTGQTNISNLEAGLANPTFNTLIKLARAFEVELSELFHTSKPIEIEDNVREISETVAIDITIRVEAQPGHIPYAIPVSEPESIYRELFQISGPMKDKKVSPLDNYGR